MMCKWSSKKMRKPEVKTCVTTEMNPTRPKYFFHILKGQWSVVQVLIFILHSIGGAYFFEFGRRSRSLGARDERVSEP